MDVPLLYTFPKVWTQSRSPMVPTPARRPAPPGSSSTALADFQQLPLFSAMDSLRVLMREASGQERRSRASATNIHYDADSAPFYSVLCMLPVSIQQLGLFPALPFVGLIFFLILSLSHGTVLRLPRGSMFSPESHFTGGLS